MSDRCSGHCCKAFLLPFSYNELRRSWVASLRAKYLPEDAPEGRILAGVVGG